MLATSGSATGPAGAPGPVVVETVAVAESSYDGTLLSLSWAAAATDGATYVVQVLAGGTVVAQQVSVRTAVPIPVALAAGGSYAVAVQVVAGSARGPSGAVVGVVSAIPGISSMEATASTVTAVVTVPSSASNVTGYNGLLYEGDAIVAGPVAATTSGGVTSVVFGYAVQPQSRYTVVMQAVGANAVGPAGTPGAVVSSVPSVTSTLYDGTNVTATWDAVGDGLVTGYVATLTDADGGVVGSPVTVEGTTAVIPAPGLEPDATYNVTVQAIGNAATGPASTAVAVLASALSITAASYDGALLSLAWAAASTPGATYRVQVAANGTAVATQASSLTSAAIPVLLGAAGSYTAAVQVVVGGSTGPLGPASGLVTAVPGSGETTATATGVTAVVEPPAVITNVQGYQGWLYEGGQQVTGPVAATTAGGVTTVAFTYTLHPSNPYAVRLQAVGASAAIAGPVAPPAGVMASIPAVTSTAFDGTQTSVTWDAVADASITGYRATLWDSDGNAIGTPVDVQTTEAVLPGPVPESGKTYSVSVQALGALSVGAASATMPVVVETVALSTAAYDGALLSLSWAAATTAGASYEVDVSANGAVVASQASGQTSAAMPVVLSSATSYSAAVRVIAGTARGNAGAATGIVAALPGVDAVVATSSTVTATVAIPSPAPNVTGYQGWLYEGDSIVAGPNAATTSGGVTSVAFPYAVAADKRYVIRVGAMGAGSVTGPQGAAAAVVSATPTVEATSYDG
ncbi:MAG TPA: fibronectin type III domain-containing protein, partial [Longimicrobium sp.]|nr:fibronectin type III domain-containing protein [Longimicrobium sp.]